MMISVEEALESILQEVDILEEQSAPILDSLELTLAEDIKSDINVPPLDNAVMDGYAVRSYDTKGASEKSSRFLRVIDTVMAGSISECHVAPGTAIRIMTGAPIPKGADSVVQFENTDEERRKKSGADHLVTEIGILCEVEPGSNIRHTGENFANSFSSNLEVMRGKYA